MRLIIQKSSLLLRALGGINVSGVVGTIPSSSTISCSRLLSTTAAVAANRLFSDKHEWISVESNVGTVGISNFAQTSLGDIVFAQLPDVDTDVEKDGECGALESVKSASDIYAPVSGKITEKNEAVEEDPALLNKSPYDEGWLFKMELSDASELDSLMDESAYEKFVSELEKDE